jgi:hypothetical protein
MLIDIMPAGKSQGEMLARLLSPWVLFPGNRELLCLYILVSCGLFLICRYQIGEGV